MTASAASRLIAAELAATPLRASSLLVTLLGDAVAPRGEIWLGHLIELLEPFGINERLVRTTVFRLVREDWLASTPVGRRSLYRLTATGRQRLEHAYRRVYTVRAGDWHGEWQIAILPDGLLGARERERLRKLLAWEGFGTIGAGIFGHPSSDAGHLRSTLEQSGDLDKFVLLEASCLPPFATVPQHRLAEQCWPLGELAAAYRCFAERFAPIGAAIDQAGVPGNAECFTLRTLLIHEFRRTQLRDPQLPLSLLAADWPGHAARRLCQELYERTFEQSEAHLAATLRCNNHALGQSVSLFRIYGAAGASPAAPTTPY